MSISSAFLWRFLDDVWDLLPTDDRKLFETYWTGLIQAAANLEQKTIEASLSSEVAEVPVFLSERWNRFVMDDETADIFQVTDSIDLIAMDKASLSQSTVFYETITVSNSSGQIPHQEALIFFDSSVRTLRYGKLVKGTISIKNADGFEFTPNRDYVVNEAEGTVQALDNGRLPTDEQVTIVYQHKEYTRDLDYVLDELRATIVRTSDSAIGDGDTVAVTYSYNGSATIPFEGTQAKVGSSVLTDTTKDFSTLLPNRTLTITEGANAGSYSIVAIIDQNNIKIAGTFPEVQAGDVVYTIDAFPHGMRVDKAIVSIPVLQNLIDEPTTVLEEGADFVVRDGILACRTALPLSQLGPEDTWQRQMWAEITKVDHETPYRNFGVLIDFFRKNSEEYKLALQGLWYTFWTGSTPGNLQRGLHILLGLPYARRAGTISKVDTNAGVIEITDSRGQIISYTIPSGLDPSVTRDQKVARFESLTTGVQIIDRNNEPGFVASRLGRAGIERFLTDMASRGAGSTDETKALELLEHHLFLPQVLTEAITQRVNITELVTFLDNMKPQWTEYVFSFLAEEDDGLTFDDEQPLDVDVAIDVSTTVSNNEWNYSLNSSVFKVHQSTGEFIAGGTQATGNFRSSTVNFGFLGIDRDDFIRIPDGPFRGYHRVLKRISNTTLSLDIPDSEIVGILNVEYMALTEEQSLGHDALHLQLEHIELNGTEFLAPTSLNTKTDIDFSGMTLVDADALSLLLLDIGNAGNEVQAITASDLELQEFDVAVPPAPAVRDHQIASAALKRTDNTGPTVTDVYAI